MIIMKFGGSSVGAPDGIARVIEIVRGRPSARIVAAAFVKAGIPALTVDASDAGLLTDERFGEVAVKALHARFFSADAPDRH